MKNQDSQSALGVDSPAGTHETPAMGQGCEVGPSFEIGAQVVCREGRCGRLAKLVIDPITDNVTGLIVEKGFLQKRDRVVPVEAVAGATDGEVHLGVGIRELETFQLYEEVVFRVPSTGWNSAKYEPQDVRIAMSPYEGIGGQSITPSRRQHIHKGVEHGSAVIGLGTKVTCRDGSVGVVDHVLVDCEHDHITHLIVGRKMVGDYHIVPIDAIARVDDDGVQLTLTRQEVRALPKYRSV